MAVLECRLGELESDDMLWRGLFSWRLFSHDPSPRGVSRAKKVYEIFRISEIPKNLARISGFLVGFPRISGICENNLFELFHCVFNDSVHLRTFLYQL